MRVALAGKGGSGKTTVASLITRALLARGDRVLAIDADINQHLGEGLGLSSEQVSAIPELGNALAQLKEILRGSNPRIRSADQMVKTTPPGFGSHLITLSQDDPIVRQFALQREQLAFLRTGGLQNEDLGQRCFHAKTGAVELVLNHLIDGRDDWVVVDLTAGADAFASGLFTRFDLTVLVVEPTRKSLSVWNQYKVYAQDFGVRLVALGNKVQDESDLLFLQEGCEGRLLGHLSHSAWVRRTERSTPPPWNALEPENSAMIDRVIAKAHLQTRDWKAYWRWAKYFHVQNAESWANAAVGCNVAKQIDDAFFSALDPPSVSEPSVHAAE